MPTFSSALLTVGTEVAYNTGSAGSTTIDVAALGAVTGSPTAFYLGASGTATSGTSSGGGALAISESGVATYTPAVGHRGGDLFEVRARNAGGDSAVVTVAVTVGNPTFTASVAVATGRVGDAYAQTVTIAGGKAPYAAFSATGLPPGLALSPPANSPARRRRRVPSPPRSR